MKTMQRDRFHKWLHWWDQQFTRLLVSLALLMLAVVNGCEREIPVLGSSNSSGYRIEGMVTDGQGRPIVGVQVRLSYQFEFVDTNPPPRKEYIVAQQVEVVTVQVVDINDRVIRILSTASYSQGPIVVTWDQRDDRRRLVPSGVYFVRYLSGGDVKHSYPVTVTGAVTDVTDEAGRFQIPSENLPIGFYPVPLSPSDGYPYAGNYRIIPFVALDFTISSQRKSAYVSLTSDRVTKVDITFQ